MCLCPVWKVISQRPGERPRTLAEYPGNAGKSLAISFREAVTRARIKLHAPLDGTQILLREVQVEQE